MHKRLNIRTNSVMLFYSDHFHHGCNFLMVVIAAVFRSADGMLREPARPLDLFSGAIIKVGINLEGDFVYSFTILEGRKHVSMCHQHLGSLSAVSQ